MSGIEACEHRCITSTFERGWHCADCKVQLLSLTLPIPLPKIAEVLKAVTQGATNEQA